MNTSPGMSRYPSTYYEDFYISESDKSDIEYLKGNIDHWIGNLVQTKDHLRTLRKYYNGVRDDKEFKYLTENFGIGTPSSIKFTNIIKPRVDSIVSQLQSDSYTYAVSCTDDKTIDLIQEEKKKKIIDDIKSAMDLFTAKMRTSVKTDAKQVQYSEFKSYTDKIADKYCTNFISDFEVAAQKVCSYFERSNEMELRLKLALMVLDLTVTGECYYRVYYDREGSDPKLDVIKPENFFHNKNTNNPFLDGTDAVVRREYLSHKQVAALYGKFMTSDQMRELFGGKFMSRTARNLSSGLDLKIYYGEDDPMLGQKYFNSAYTVEVMHVEWLATNEIEIDEEEMNRLQLLKDGHNYKIGDKIRRLDRYEGTRIGGSVYVNCGKSEQVPRTNNDPYNCGFSYGGLLHNDRSGTPYSMVGAMKDLQDMYDLTIFHRDNLLANSGVRGNRVNVAGIPKVLGNDFMERLFKFMALKKNGIELIDPTEQGAQLFNHYGDFDNTVDGNSIAAINGILAQIEHQADIIAGTNPQMLGMINERDAVANVKLSTSKSLMINQPLFELFRSSQHRIMKDLVNVAQLSYRNGKKISYIANGESYVFSIIPEKFSFTDYAISIEYASKDVTKVDKLKDLTKELVGVGLIEPDVLVKALLSGSTTEITQLITKNWSKIKAEKDAVGKLSQQIEQYEKTIKELQGQLNNISQQLEASKANNNEAKLKEVEYKQEESKRKLDIEEDKAIAQKEFNDAQLDLKREVVQLEREQLYLGVGNSKEIKNL